ncbi:ATP-dependent endonuclease [Mucilaginibacter sp. 44-25]|uniref:ATP-dependent endonuclease n=1 Tax=Mucilaginibacter sp. 44-25 TaxID=1895794 RepID=UPI0009590DF7|nr:ATP-dependent endonuclease [Mucilaginibacter sp. 44-25]OJW17286.1 MAG: ATP-dependent endonuclease [Mucilaginibacter sp. 44-25]
MKLKKIKVRNFRLLKDFGMDLEDILSLVIGKNNTGKTSLVAVLQRFLGEKTKDFSCDDFNIDFQKDLRAIIEDGESFVLDPPGITLKLFIEYKDADDLTNISQLLVDLDPDNRIVVLAFEYILTDDKLALLHADFVTYKAERVLKIEQKIKVALSEDSMQKEVLETVRKQKLKTMFFDFFKAGIHKYFDLRKKILWYDKDLEQEDDTQFTDITTENIKLDRLINFKVISARRDVSNKDSDKTLSSLSSQYYEKRENMVGTDAVKRFKDAITNSDEELDQIYELLFEKVLSTVEKFGGTKKGDSVIKIISTLQQRNLLRGNTTVMYDHHEEHSLPESYNGLGYMNLIGMIFEIEVMLTDFRREQFPEEQPADINLLFIEEPEAHTHPQMQYVFIKNIKSILHNASMGKDDGGRQFNLQSVITTHSSHIAAESRFNDIKYFYRKDLNAVIAKNLSDLEKEYTKDGQRENFRFLKQYLTLNRAELFFADKAIFIEGDTERILLPAMMKKFDQEHIDNPLLSQNISICEVGAYSHIFERFIHFIGVKSLIVTDLDAGKKITDDEKTKTVGCAPDDPQVSVTTNASLAFFHGRNDITYFLGLTIQTKSMLKDHNVDPPVWKTDPDGHLAIVHQVKETNADGKENLARSFEDAFFHLNRKFITDNKTGFKSLKHIKYFEDAAKNSYELAEACIDKKPSFAIEVLLNSQTNSDDKEFSNWQTPKYIREGLEWLKEN